MAMNSVIPFTDYQYQGLPYVTLGVENINYYLLKYEDLYVSFTYTF